MSVLPIHHEPRLQSLDEFNEQQRPVHQRMEDMRKPIQCGIACPSCGQELWNDQAMHEVQPRPWARMGVHCRAAGCGYKGERLL